MAEIVSATPPTISTLDFPETVRLNALASGWISYYDPDLDVVYARFAVADGRYSHLLITTPTMTSPQGRLSFALKCTAYAQQITLAVTLIDARGESSPPFKLVFSCGRPPLYNFDAEQARVLPIEQRIGLNVFIIDDGETALAEGATFPEGALLGEPHSAVERALQAEVLPKLAGIWDQCSLGFELVGAWVVKPDRVTLAGGKSLAEALFIRQDGALVIRHGRAAGDLLRQATFTLWQAAQAQEPRAARAFNVIIVGARILTMWEGQLTDIEGFSEGGWPNYALVRWGAILPEVTPKQMIATLAHELGHNLGLGHPGEDGLSDTRSDPLNLMRGSGVSPQPRARLLASQCQRVGNTLTQLADLLQNVSGTTTSPNPPDAAEATVRWLSSCPNEEKTCTGKVELSVAAEGFLDLERFSFALFEYSPDGEHFIEIGVDRSYQDGFRVLWDTTTIPNGEYLLRATVTDAEGVRASVEVRVIIQN